jgi:HEAT repeat protein
LPAGRLSPEEGLIDDVLGEILAQSETHPLDALFHALEEAARSGRWEVKRRAAEALPRLVQLQPEATFRLAQILRQDYHPDYRADIRRRVVEAVPRLYPHRPQAALQLLESREGDEVYMAMAAVEALHDLEQAGQVTAETVERYFQALQVEGRPASEQPVILFLRRLLRESQAGPEAALALMRDNRDHPERLFKICILRVAPRLLRPQTAAVFELLFYFLRRDEAGQPAEHQNLRRPVSRALPEILALLAEAGPELRANIGRLLRLLASDPDIHVRRALGDALDHLAAINAEEAAATLEPMLKDEDAYVRQRAWHALLYLADLYPERAAAFYTQLLIEKNVE